MLTVIFFAAASLLALAGAVKLRRPEATARALSTLGMREHRSLARALGVAEVVVGAGALASPALLAPAVALLYTSFAVFVAQALARGVPLESCGCLGETDTEPSRAHVVVTVLAALGATAAALWPPLGLDTLVASDPVAGTLLAVGVGTAVYLAYLTLVFLPGAISAYQRPVRDHRG